MKKEILILLFLFSFGSCFAQEINFQGTAYSPSETIIGSINNVVGELTTGNFQIYEGRREVFFEKNIMKVNQTYYFYTIPTKEGEFVLKINNLLYNNSGKISSINAEKNFTVANRNNSLEFAVKPGLYEGQNPEVVVTNLKLTKINITVDKSLIELNPQESRKISLAVKEGFSLYTLGSYSIPILKFGTLINNATNTSGVNDSAVNTTYIGCVGLTVPPFFSIATGDTVNYSIIIQNNCSEEINNITIASTYKDISFYNNPVNLKLNEISTVNFSLLGTASGEYFANLSLTHADREIALAQIKIYCFQNKTILENFNQAYDNPVQKNCTEMNGTLCEENEACSTENILYDKTGRTCCFTKCVNPNEKPTNWLNILVAIVGILVIAVIAYFLLKRLKGIKAPRIEDKFKEAQKHYEKNLSGAKK